MGTTPNDKLQASSTKPINPQTRLPFTEVIIRRFGLRVIERYGSDMGPITEN